MLERTAPIAVFDSGVGGIGVLRELKRQLPQESFLYFGDCANAPYGERTTAEIRALVLSRAEHLLARAKALVLACNTATAAAAEELRRRFAEPIIGMEPAIRPALSVCPHPRILLLATAATLREGKLTALLSRCAGRAEISLLAAPGLVRLAERGVTRGAEVQAYLRRLLAPLRGQRFDAAVLGCTHFPFFREELSLALGGIPLLDGAAGTARETARRLQAAGIAREAPEPFGRALEVCAGTTLRAEPAQQGRTTPGARAGAVSCADLAQQGGVIPDARTGAMLGAAPPFPWHERRILLASSRRTALPLMRALLYAPGGV